ncbi:MAG: ABC transporter permease, partial [Aminobacteriaceae bacterium]
MLKYLVKRFFQTAVVLFVVSVIVFCVMSFTGDPVLMIVPPNATDAQIAEARIALGLDQPLWVQYKVFLFNLLKGDLGISYIFKRPALTLIVERMPTTFRLGVFGMLVGLALALPLGILAALYEGRFIDRAIQLLISVNQAVPSFWLALMLIIVFGVHLGWLPTTGADSWRHFIMPTLVLGLSVLPALARLAR